MDHASITSMPYLSHLKNLATVQVHYSSLTEIPRNTIDGLTKIPAFYFLRSRINIMPNISYLTSLKMIYLSFNRIRYIPKGTLHGLPNLQTLALNYNMISHINGLQQLVVSRLQLDGNQLVTLPDLFPLPVWILYLGDNPFLCNQSLCWLRMWPWYKRLPSIRNPVCAEPLHLKGINVMNVEHVIYAYIDMCVYVHDASIIFQITDFGQSLDRFTAGTMDLDTTSMDK